MTQRQSSTGDKASVGVTMAAYVLLYTGTGGAAGQQQQVDVSTDAAPLLSVSLESPSDLDYVIDSATVRSFKFQTFLAEWRRERGAMSCVAEMAMLPAYQKIIGMGEDVLPLILTQLKSEGHAPDHWFWALAAIAHDNPVPQESRGRLSEMAKAWLEWGQKEGYV